MFPITRKLTSRMSAFNDYYNIRLIKDKYQQSFDFKFEFASRKKVLKYINEIDCNKSSGGDIPANFIKMVKKELTVPLANWINNCISSSTFPNELKIADIILVYKKQDVIKLTIDQLVY